MNSVTRLRPFTVDSAALITSDVNALDGTTNPFLVGAFPRCPILDQEELPPFYKNLIGRTAGKERLIEAYTGLAETPPTDCQRLHRLLDF